MTACPTGCLEPDLLRRAAIVVAAVALAACAGGPPTSKTAARPTAAPPAAPPLVVERQWLQSWFKGTPVVIAQDGAGPVAVDVPLAFAFDAGRAAVKPPLAAVLDKVAEALRRQPGLRLALVAAPGDRADDTRLAQRRAGAVRAHLRGRGVGSAQLPAARAEAGKAVRLRIESRDSPM